MELAFLGAGPGQVTGLLGSLDGSTALLPENPAGLLPRQGPLQLASPSAFYDQEQRAVNLAWEREVEEMVVLGDESLDTNTAWSRPGHFGWWIREGSRRD